MDKLYERATFISPFPVTGLVSGSGYEIAISFDDHYIRVETVPSPTTGKSYVLLYTTIGEMLTEWRFYHEMPKENRPILKKMTARRRAIFSFSLKDVFISTF